MKTDLKKLLKEQSAEEVAKALLIENDEVQSQNEKLKELLQYAVEDMNKECFAICGRVNVNECDMECNECENGCFCDDCSRESNFEWQHADKARELGVGL